MVEKEENNDYYFQQNDIMGGPRMRKKKKSLWQGDVSFPFSAANEYKITTNRPLWNDMKWHDMIWNDTKLHHTVPQTEGSGN